MRLCPCLDKGVERSATNQNCLQDLQISRFLEMFKDFRDLEKQEYMANSYMVNNIFSCFRVYKNENIQ